jgi:hypothetical protein
MCNVEWDPQAVTPPDSHAGGWHTLTLGPEGDITSCDRGIEYLLGSQADVLAGKAITEVMPELPFSAQTPGYNLAYAIFHGANGAKVRRTARSGNGNCLAVETVLSSRNVDGRRSITLNFRSA